jgi:deoxyribodipyrimidine photo-lyase
VKTIIWWIRRDLRLSDNLALFSALQQCEILLPLFILDDHLLKGSDHKRQSFLLEGLKHLDTDLKRKGSSLVIHRGDPVEVLTRIARVTQASSVFASADSSPYARQRDQRVSQNVALSLFPGVTAHPPSAVLKTDGTPYTIFTPYSRAWKALPLPSPLSAPVPDFFPPLPAGIETLPLPEYSPVPGFPASEAEAQRRLDEFARGPIYAYAEARNQLAQPGTSNLSPYLRFGMLSPRQAVAASVRALVDAHTSTERRGCETWLGELIWREFYTAILYHFPEVLKTAFKPSMRDLVWRDDAALLHAWQEGLTGYPVVDAAMRQLTQTGWMHNRTRMITASFLVKDLLINWQEGERWFINKLVDGDPAANNGGWQWTAGTGTDAAPYYRIFNPVLQGQKFDPNGDTIRRWVPELANIPTSYIHTPWQMPEDVQRAFGVRINHDYPASVVEHALARQHYLEMIKRT